MPADVRPKCSDHICSTNNRNIDPRAIINDLDGDRILFDYISQQMLETLVNITVKSYFTSVGSDPPRTDTSRVDEPLLKGF